MPLSYGAAKASTEGESRCNVALYPMALTRAISLAGYIKHMNKGRPELKYIGYEWEEDGKLCFLKSRVAFA